MRLQLFLSFVLLLICIFQLFLQWAWQLSYLEGKKRSFKNKRKLKLLSQEKAIFLLDLCNICHTCLTTAPWGMSQRVSQEGWQKLSENICREGGWGWEGGEARKPANIQSPLTLSTSFCSNSSFWWGRRHFWNSATWGAATGSLAVLSCLSTCGRVSENTCKGMFHFLAGLSSKV